MKVFNKALPILLVLLANGNIQAQFQKKFTIDVGVSPLFPSKEALRADRFPYLFSNFQYGYGTYTNVLYNPSRKFSIGVAINLSTFQSWEDPRAFGNSSGDDSFFNTYSIDPNIKYKLWVKRISPFVMAGLGATVYHAKRAQTEVLFEDFYPWDYEASSEVPWVSIDEVLIYEPGYEVKPRTAFNVLGAVGFDIKVSETIGVTLMACYNISFTSGNFTLDQNLKYLSFPIGVNFSLGKSKTL